MATHPYMLNIARSLFLDLTSDVLPGMEVVSAVTSNCQEWNVSNNYNWNFQSTSGAWLTSPFLIKHWITSSMISLIYIFKVTLLVRKRVGLYILKWGICTGQTLDSICQIFPNYVDVRQEDDIFCLVSDGLIMLAQENSPCFVDKRKGGH